jgi:type IV secretion system protein VirB10
MKGASDLSSEQNDIRPLVGSANGSRGVWIFASAAVIGAAILFVTLETRRETVTAPAIGPVRDQPVGVISSPPELFIPPTYMGTPSPEWPVPDQTGSDVAPEASASRLSTRGESVGAPPPRAQEGPRGRQGVALQTAPYPVIPYTPPSPQVVYNPNAPRPIGGERSMELGNQADRVRASQFINPATTVPKGTLIAAVLETALDSTRAGYARAIISRDVFGFDGSKVLIPRGSRLVGEYKADLGAGQTRALIQWQRLMRPDGAIISLDSPSADPLGRAGVEGKVNSHFFDRFGGAILQSVLNIGTQVAASKISDGAVVYAIPVPTQGLPVTPPDKVQPTLKVRQGKSVSVFVAKDLDFSTVD